ncbi:MAG TPA: sensor domain-containing diguanylate cyclase, partial [Chthoniobacterales bacterium]|nr:sensor domain-containing diguanylate cyclase [Chthoniobacterales bacterium]
RVGKVLEQTIAGRRAFSGVTNRVMRQDGGMVILETSGIPLFSEDGRFRGYRGIGRDVTAMSERSQQLESVYTLAPLPLFVVDREHRFVEVNNAFAALCGAPVSEILDRKVAEFVPGAEESLRRDFATIDSGEDVADHEYVWNGREYMGSIRPLRNLMGRIVGLSTAWLDITERNLASRSLSEANERLERYAHEDYLTGLWNRRTLDDRLVTEVRRSHRSKRPVSILMADVDFFKRYNDHYGHQAGDECLKAVSGVFKTTLHRAGDTAGRYGGEEFCAVLAETDLTGALSVAEALRAAVEALAIPHEGNPVGRVTISVGVSALDFSGPGKMEETSAKALVASADTALYAAKTAGRNTVR